MDSAPERGYPCKPCDKVFSSWKSLWDHKCRFRELGMEDHKNCSECGIRFEQARSELLHVQRSHQPSQDLRCPGCGRGPFARVGTLIAHIERGECTRISSTDIAKLREAKLDFHRELDRLAEEPSKGSYVNYMSQIRVEPWTSVVEAPSDEQPGELNETDYPELVQRKDSENQARRAQQQSPTKTLTAKWSTLREEKNMDKENTPMKDPTNKPLAEKWQGAWGTRDAQAVALKFPRKQRITPTDEQLEAATAPAPKAAVDALEIDNPNHPYFNASNYLCTDINKYICPRLGCGKCYRSKYALITHLRSPAHGDKSYQCPKCLRIFKSVEAITYHAESAGRCRIRETEHYGSFLDQITGGVVQVDRDAEEEELRYMVKEDVVNDMVW